MAPGVFFLFCEKHFNQIVSEIPNGHTQSLMSLFCFLLPWNAAQKKLVFFSQLTFTFKTYHGIYTITKRTQWHELPYITSLSSNPRQIWKLSQRSFARLHRRFLSVEYSVTKVLVRRWIGH